MEDYLINKVWKGSNQQSCDKLSALIDKFPPPKHNGEQLNKMGTEKKDTGLKVIQPMEYLDKECSE